MKIALHDMDQTGFPNLALCKLAAHFRAEGHQVRMNDDPLFFRPDRELGSRVFSWSPPLPPGIESGLALPDVIEHTAPDTSIYLLFDPATAIGFTSRGCIRKCDFCTVHEKEGWIRHYADPSEFVDPDRHNKVILLDNNLLASPGFEIVADYFKIHKLTVDITQGLDIRLVSDKNAEKLRHITFDQIRFAFDSMDYREELIAGVSTLRHWRVTPLTKYRCYLLHRPGDDIIDRIRLLEGLHVDPFVMPYIAPDGSRSPAHVARWSNNPAVYRSTPWEEYSRRNSS